MKYERHSFMSAKFQYDPNWSFPLPLYHTIMHTQRSTVAVVKNIGYISD